MAKCVKMRDGEYAGKAIRVPDDYARELVSAERAEYVNKDEWKRQEHGRLVPKGMV